MGHVVADELVGREVALAGLQLAVDGAVAGRGRLVLVSGEPGIGKTALVDSAVADARRDGRLLWATCWDGAGAPAYWPWIQVLRQHAQRTDRQTLDAQLGPDADEVSRIADHAQPLTGSPPPVDRDPGRARFRLFDAVSSFLVRVAADRPLCVVLDDLQWADVSSVLLLGFLARRLPASSLLVIGCFRDTEVGPGHPVRALVGDVGTDSELIELAGLDREGVARLIAVAGGVDPRRELVDQVFARTAGNPFFVREVTRLLASRGGVNQVDGRRPRIPDGVRQVVEQRLARLPQACTDLLAVAAVAGQEVGAAVLSRAGRSTPAAVQELTEIAVRARVLVEPETAASPYRFGHDLFRETLYDGLAGPVRADLHRRVGEALEELGSTGAEVGVAELAHHFLLAAVGSDGADDHGGDGARRTVDVAVRHCVAAAEEATRRLAHADAVGQYRRALDGLGGAGLLSAAARLELLLGSGNARRATGDVGGAHEDYRLALDLARHSGDAVGLARAALGVVALGLVSGTGHDAPITLLEEALAALGTGSGELRARVMAGLARVVYHSLGDDDTRAGELSRAALDLARSAGDDSTLAVCLLARHDSLWFPGTASERHDLAAEIGQVARRAGDQELIAESCLLRATAELESGRQQCLRDLEEFDRMASALQQPRWRYLSLTRRATVATMTGQLATAEAVLAEAVTLGAEIDEPDRENVEFTQVWELRSVQGRRAELEPALRNLSTSPLRELAMAHLALARLDRGDHDGAREVLAPLVAHPPSFPRDLMLVLRWSNLGEAAAALGLTGFCARCYDTLSPHAGSAVVTAGAVGFGGAVDHHLGVLAAALGRTDAAIDHFADAAEMHGRLGARPWLAMTQVEWAAALRARDRAGDRGRVAELLAAARDTAEAVGMPTILTRIDVLDAVVVNGFRREGEVWTLSYDGTDVRLKDAKGLGDIAVLLGAQGREVPATTLLGAADPNRTAGRLGADPTLDATARASYRARLDELDGVLDDADRAADPARAAAAHAEREFLIRELAAAVGLGGRNRGLGDDAERARKAVTARIRDSLGRIASAHPRLGEHLQGSITTGLFCCYAPPSPTSWRV